MTEAIPHEEVPGAPWWRRLAFWRRTRAPRRQTKASFGELVDAWLGREAPGGNDNYADVRTAFERVHGEIRDYWICPHSKMAVAMTLVDPRPRILKHKRHDVHTNFEPLVRNHPEVAPMLHQAELHYVAARNALRSLGERQLVHWLFVWMRDLMILAPPPLSSNEKLPLGEELLQPFRDELESIAAEYDRTASSEARIAYLGGMLRGLAVLCALMVPVGLLLPEHVPIDRSLFFGCLIAGALGALVSVVTRMSAEKFPVRHEVGRRYIIRVAMFRPFVGSVFGLVVYLALTGDVIQIAIPEDDDNSRFAFFLVFAFTAGFSERLVKEVIRQAEPQEPPRAS